MQGSIPHMFYVYFLQEVFSMAFTKINIAEQSFNRLN